MQFRVKTKTFIALLRAAVLVRKDITLTFTKTAVCASIATDNTAYINYSLPCEGDGEVEVSFDAPTLINALKIFTEDEVDVVIGDVIKVNGNKHKASVPKYVASPSFVMKAYEGEIVGAVQSKDIIDAIAVMGDAQDIRFDASETTIKCGIITDPVTSIIVDLEPSPYSRHGSATASYSPILMKELTPVLKDFDIITISYGQDKPIEFVGRATNDSNLRLFIPKVV